MRSNVNDWLPFLVLLIFRIISVPGMRSVDVTLFRGVGCLIPFAAGTLLLLSEDTILI